MKAVQNSIELLRGIQERASEATDALGGDAIPAGAIRRYTERALAIGNRARGFDHRAEAVTALRLGIHLFGLGELPDSLESLERCIHRTSEASLVGLQARMLKGLVLERLGNPSEAIHEYQAIVDAAGEREADRSRRAGGQDMLYPSGALGILDQVRQRLDSLKVTPQPLKD